MKSRILLLFAIFLFTHGCSSSSGTWGWYVIDPSTKAGWINIKFLIGGFYATIALSLIAAVLSILLGLLVAMPGEFLGRLVLGEEDGLVKVFGATIY